MSQLNNEGKIENIEETKEKKTKQKKKMKTSTKIIIFLVFFTLVCVGITTALVFIYKKNNVAIEEKIEEQKKIYEAEDDGFGIKSLTERYNGNDLKIEDLEDAKGTRTPLNEYDTNTNKISIGYISIDGLKNEEIENKINQEIKNKVYGMYTNDELNNQSIDRINIGAYAEANFGNVLSIQIYKGIDYKTTNNDYKYEHNVEYLNYDLTTGNKIKFEELFTNKTSLKNVLIPAINKSLRDTYMQNNDSMEFDFSKVDLSEIEEKSYKVLNSVMNDIENIKFGFSYSNIYIFLNNQDITIDMTDIYHNIAIYKRFLTKDTIFDGSYSTKVKNAFVFSIIYTGDEEDLKVYKILEDLEDNLRVEAKVSCYQKIYNEKEGKIIYDDYVGIIADQIEKLKVEAKNNPSKQILYVADYWISGYENEILAKDGIKNIMTNTHGYGRIYRMDKKYYDETFYLEMAKQQRSPFAGGNDVMIYYVEENDKNVDVEDINQEYETFDLFTNKTENQLIGIHEITSIIEQLEIEKAEVNQPDFVDYFQMGDYYIYRINEIKQRYNLNDDKEFKEYEDRVIELIDEIKTLVQEKQAKIEQEMINSQTEQQTNTTDTNNTVVNNIEQTNLQNETVNNNTNP